MCFEWICFESCDNAWRSEQCIDSPVSSASVISSLVQLSLQDRGMNASTSVLACCQCGKFERNMPSFYFLLLHITFYYFHGDKTRGVSGIDNILCWLSLTLLYLFIPAKNITQIWADVIIINPNYWNKIWQMLTSHFWKCTETDCLFGCIPLNGTLV